MPQCDEFEAAVEQWRELASDQGAKFDTVIDIDSGSLEPFVTWGTNPGMVVPVTGRVPDPASFEDAGDRQAAERALEYMGLEPDTAIQDIKIDRVFLGSCTNSRIEDLRAAAEVVRDKSVSNHVYAMVVPGSNAVKRQAESEGLDRIFRDAGLRLERGGLLDVPGHEPGRSPTRRALRVNIQP